MRAAPASAAPRTRREAGRIPARHAQQLLKRTSAAWTCAGDQAARSPLGRPAEVQREWSRLAAISAHRRLMGSPSLRSSILSG
jgi:hypothetical protein